MTQRYLRSDRSRHISCRTCSKVDEFVPETMLVNLRIVCQAGGIRGLTAAAASPAESTQKLTDQYHKTIVSTLEESVKLTQRYLGSDRSHRISCRTCSKVDKFVPETMLVNLRIVCQARSLSDPTAAAASPAEPAQKLTDQYRTTILST